MLGSLFGEDSGEGDIIYDVTQKIRISVVTRPALDSSVQPGLDAQVIPITIQRLVWDSGGELSHAESIEDPKADLDLATASATKLSGDQMRITVIVRPCGSTQMLVRALPRLLHRA